MLKWIGCICEVKSCKVTNYKKCNFDQSSADEII